MLPLSEIIIIGVIIVAAIIIFAIPKGKKKVSFIATKYVPRKERVEFYAKEK